MDFKSIVMSRFAAKKFDGKGVPEQKMHELFELIRFAPSSFNLQPWKIHVITDPKVKEKLAPSAFNQLQITTCSHLLVFCADTDIEKNIALLEKKMHASGVPKENVDPYVKMMSGFFINMTKEQRLAWAKNQVYIAMGNALNGAKSLGLDSCPMEGFNPAEFAKALSLPDSVVPAVLVPVGYPDDTPRPKIRFERKEVFVQ